MGTINRIETDFKDSTVLGVVWGDREDWEDWNDWDFQDYWDRLEGLDRFEDWDYSDDQEFALSPVLEPGFDHESCPSRITRRMVVDTRDLRWDRDWRPDLVLMVCRELDNPPDFTGCPVRVVHTRRGREECLVGVDCCINTDTPARDRRHFRTHPQFVKRFEKRTRERHRQSRRAREHARWNQVSV